MNWRDFYDTTFTERNFRTDYIALLWLDFYVIEITRCQCLKYSTIQFVMQVK